MSKNNQSYSLLQEKFHQLARIEHAITFLQWDHMVMMPHGGNESRSNSMAELSEIHHQFLTSPEIGELLASAGAAETDPAILRSIAEMKREYQAATCLTAALVKAKALAGSRCEHGWRDQRKSNDWNGFLKNFKEVVSLSREEAQARYDAEPDSFPTPYDSLLDLYCTGDDSVFIDTLFDELRAELPGLITEITEHQKRQATRPGIDPADCSFPEQQQMALSRELMTALGFDFNQGRLDLSVHPFSTGGRGDHRITTRLQDHEYLEALLATAHETGHACYERGLPEQWDELPVGGACNLCLHESQSLFFEKHLFLSKPFLHYFAPRIAHHFNLKTPLSGAQLYHTGTRVKPGFIRIEADEATYPLHVILRYEIEKALINGEIEVDALPEIWDEKMQSYLGLSTKGNYRDGCMQDMHWTDGGFGYFPSYTMGALNSAQLAARMRNVTPDWYQRMEKGDLGFVHEWLATNIWQKGSTMDSQDIIRHATDSPTSCTAFLEHLRNRYLHDQY